MLWSYWENSMHVVKEQVSDNPVYKVISETDGNKSRVLDQNLLHLVSDLPVGPPAAEKKSRTMPKKRTEPKSVERARERATTEQQDRP